MRETGSSAQNKSLKIYIIRHGETDANKEGRLQGWSDWDLNEMGVLLARETGRALKGTSFDLCVTSPLKRALQTAQIVLEESGNGSCPLLYEDDIREINMGRYEGKLIKGDPEVDMSLARAFLYDPISCPAFPEGESISQLMERTQRFLKELAKKDYETVLVSTHGCALRAMLNFLYENKEDFWHGHVPYNCCINIVEAENGELKLAAEDLIFYDEALCIDRYR